MSASKKEVEGSFMSLVETSVSTIFFIATLLQPFLVANFVPLFVIKSLASNLDYSWKNAQTQSVLFQKSKVLFPECLMFDVYSIGMFQLELLNQLIHNQIFNGCPIAQTGSNNPHIVYFAIKMVKEMIKADIFPALIQ